MLGPGGAYIPYIAYTEGKKEEKMRRGKYNQSITFKERKYERYS
jgi:hypothetical protein